MRILSFLALSSVVCSAQVCGPTPEIKSALDESAKVPAADRLNAARALRDKYPDNFWVQRAYMNRVGNPDLVIDEYQKALESHPDDPNYLWYRGSSLTSVHTPDAIRYLDQVLEKNPDFAAAHAKLVVIYASPNFKNADKLRTHLQAFLKACPDSELNFYSYLERMDAPDLVRESALNLRKVLAARDDPSDLYYYRTLWAIEFKANPSQYDQVRERVRGDLERLRKIGIADHRQLATTMREGYKVLGDQDGLKWVDQQVPPPAASSSSAVMEAYQKFNKEHPFPTGTVPRDVMDARNKALLDATAEWIRKWPDEEFAWSQRYFALSFGSRTPGPDAAIEEVADAKLRLARKSSNPANLKFSVAQMYISRKMHLDEVELLIKGGLADLEKQRMDVPSDLYPPVNSPNSRANILSTRAMGQSSLCDYYQNEARWDQLGPALSEWRKTLDQQKVAAFAQSYQENNWKSSYSRYWQKMAALAEQQEHKVDALAYYKRALDPEYRPDNQPKFMTDMVVTKARKLWNTLGGTDEAWAEWSKTSEAPKRETALSTSTTTRKEPEETNRQLPPFTIKDVTGRQWTLADVKGKITLINLWATWCGPCRDELPLLQKLHDRIKDRKDIAVLTLNTDDNPGLIDPFMKENHYSFPVLPARDYVDSIVPYLSIPRNWIINRDGLLKSATVGFNPSAGETWIDKTLKSLEEESGHPTTNTAAAKPPQPQGSFLDRTLAMIEANPTEPDVVVRGEFGVRSENEPEVAKPAQPRGPQVALNSPLPQFSLKDIAGQPWTLANLHGKVTLITVWASWCGPCRKELPMVQELYERIRERTDIQIVTLNTDEDPAAIKAFLNKNHYTFPVLPAHDYSRSVVARLTIPRNWIVDREGIVRSSSVGYSASEGKAWIGKTLKSLEKLENGTN